MGSNKVNMLRYADGLDKVLMFFGTLGSIGDGMQYPVMMYVLSDVINNYGAVAADTNFNKTVDKYALRLFFVAVGVGAAAFVEGLCWARTAERQTSRIRMEYLKAVLRQEVSFFDTQASGSSTTYQVVSTVSSDATSIQVSFCEKIPNCIAYMSTFFFCFILAFVLSWKLALAALPLSIMFVAPTLVFGKMMIDVAVQTLEAYAVAGGVAEQAISSVRTVYSYVGERQTLVKYSKSLEKVMELGVKQGFAKGLMLGSLGLICTGWAFQAWVGTYLVTEKHEQGGRVFTAGFNMLFGGMSVLGALPNITAITEGKAAATRIFEMIDHVPEIDTEVRKGKALSHVRGEIWFEDVYFNYPSRPDSPILQGLNLKVPAGETVGLVGGSGSGKSTTIALLQRFYDPIQGQILLDGHKIRRLQLKWWRSQMGLVNQEPVLFATTITENILFGKEDASMDDVISAAKTANADDFISKLPNGYETQVGQFGLQLSGGQKQRIAIARALIRNPKILLLDEATSALDSQSEKLVQEAIDKASVGRTTIIIAHRLSTIRRADLIAVLSDGRVIESGTHNELTGLNSGQGGEYSKMLNLQQVETLSEQLHDNFNYQMDDASPHYKTSIDASPYYGHHRSIALSPASVRSSYQGTPVMNPLSPAFSIYSFSINMGYSGSDDELNLKDSPHPPSLWRLMKMNAPEWRSALLGCAGALGYGAVQPINAYCVGGLISTYFLTDKKAIKSKSRDLSYVFLGLAGFNFFVCIVQHYNFAVMGEKLTNRVREKVLAKLLTFEVGWFDQDENKSAVICARLASEAAMVKSLVGDRISLLLSTAFGAVFAYTVSLFLTWKLSLVMIAVQPLLIGSFYARSLVMSSNTENASKAQRQGSQIASEAVINHRTITAFSSQKRVLGLFRDTLEGPRKASVKQSWYAGLGLSSSQFFNTASTALAYWYGGRLLAQNQISAEHLFKAFFILLFTAFFIADAGTMTSDLSKGSNAIRCLFQILDRDSEIDPDNNTYGPDTNKRLVGLIELQNVFFAYPARPEQMIFKGLSLKIEAGATVALVGQSGSGKSTIIGLISRFYDPIRGSVLIDDQNIKNYNLRLMRSHIAIVSQEPTLFAGTIRDNIAYGNESARESEIEKAAVLANAHEFISGMNEGYGTYCGERGVQLSGGQRQRIALARAILKNPAILLLDEATSALDSVSEKLVQEALEKMMVGRSCVIVAHRLSTIQKAETIAVIKNGKVAEQGSHSELLSIGQTGAYHSLVKAQNGSSPYR